MNIDELLSGRPRDDTLITETIILEYREPVYRLALSILDDPDEALDAVQETFLLAASRLRQYQPGTNFRAWLFAIAVNLCRGQLRKRRVRQSLQTVLVAIQSRISPPHPEEMVIRHETHVQLWHAVDQLHERHRFPLILRIVHELSIREIAQILEIPEKTVYTRLYDAYEKVRKRLETDTIPDIHDQPSQNRF